MPSLAVFFAVAFGLSSAVAAVVWRVEPGPLGRMGLFLLFMWGPALGAVVAQRVAGAKVLQPLGVTLRPNRWWLVAWLAPVVVAVVTAGVGALFPGVELQVSPDTLLARIADSVPAEELAEARASLSKLPPAATISLLLLQVLIAGLSINALAAFGEELGWRGFLHVRLAHLGFWRRSVVVGVAWGAWHAPVILLGHNYPDHPVVGVFMMIVFTILLSAPFELVRERGGSVLAASVLHGSINASAGLAVLFLRGGSDLLVGLTGLAGFLVLVVVNVGVHLLRSRRPAPSTPSAR